MEPRAALAEWEGGKVTVWTGTQRPFGVRGELAQAFGIPEAQARVIVPDTGSGYGGKHNGDAALEAARMVRRTGKPAAPLVVDLVVRATAPQAGQREAVADLVRCV